LKGFLKEWQKEFQEAWRGVFPAGSEAAWPVA
jgi:hypothetical protein